MSSHVYHRFIENDERRLSYYIAGKEDSEHTLFFLNGLYHGHNTWIKQQRYSYFNKNYKMIFMDYRGLGESIEKVKKEYSFSDIVNDIRLIMDREGVNKANIAGYSVGGMIAMWFAHCCPERVDKLILLNTSTRVSSHGTKLIDGLSKLVKAGTSLEKIFLLIYPWNHSDVYLDKVGNIEEGICKNYSLYNKNIDSLFALIAAIRDRIDILPFIEYITMPTLIIGCDEDVIFPSSFQEDLAAQMRNCKYHVINNCGHASFVEKYNEVNLLIEEFLRDGSSIK